MSENIDYISSEKSVRSSLGDLTPKNNKPKGLAYTVNISPKDYVSKTGVWGVLSPDEQCKFLKRLHKHGKLCLEEYLDSDLEEYFDNKVCFEFTKNGELHSHGYYILQDKYTGYKRYEILLSKSLKSMLPKSKWNVLVKQMEDYDKWNEYMMKEVETSGYKPYNAQYCEITRHDIMWYISKDQNETIEKKGAERSESD